MDTSLNQRPNIQVKYEHLYGVLKACAEAWLDSAGNDGPALFDARLNRFPKADITGVHLDRFGFQAFGADDPNFANDREYATAHGYNLDLFEQVSRHPRLKIVDAETGLLRQGQGNATALLVWRRRG